MVECAQDSGNASVPFARGDDGTLYVNATRLCLMVGIDPTSIQLRLVMWRSLAEFMDLSFCDDPYVDFLPASMIPDFLETLKPDAVRVGHLDKLKFFQQMLVHINDLTDQTENVAMPEWSAEKMTRVHRFVVTRLIEVRKPLRAALRAKAST